MDHTPISVRNSTKFDEIKRTSTDIGKAVPAVTTILFHSSALTAVLLIWP